MSPLKILQRNQAGSTIVVALMIAGLIGVIALAILNWNRIQLKANQQLNLPVIAQQIKQKLVGAILSPQSWEITQRNNASIFKGFTAGTGQADKLDIFLTDPERAYYPSREATAGFDLHANPCSGFDSLQGNDDCPFHYEIALIDRKKVNNNWVDTVQLTLSFRPRSSNLVLKTSGPEYSFILSRNFPETSLGGLMLMTMEDQCSGATAYRGPVENKQKTKCDPSYTKPISCGTGKVIKSFDRQGSPLCGNPI
jgi:hypothetical protein